MLKINKINIKKIEWEKELGNSRLEFKISGDNIDYVIVNTIRRTIFSEIPIYAFNEFNFEKNTSIFHNNYLKLRFKHLPVWTIENTIDFIEPVKTNTNDTDIEEDTNENMVDQIQLNVEKNPNSSTLKQLTMYVNYKNKTHDIVSVTSSDAKFYYEEKQIPSPYHVPILLVKLQPDQEITFSAITKIGIEQEDAMYSAVCVSAYKQINDNEFDFFLESRGQINEKRILLVALININRRLDNMNKLINESEINEGQNGMIVIHNEDHTLGNLIARGMQKHNKISFAGYNLPHPLAKKVNFHYKLKENDNIKSVINDVIDYYKNLFGQINEIIIKELD